MTARCECKKNYDSNCLASLHALYRYVTLDLDRSLSTCQSGTGSCYPHPLSIPPSFPTGVLGV